MVVEMLSNVVSVDFEEVSVGAGTDSVGVLVSVTTYPRSETVKK